MFAASPPAAVGEDSDGSSGGFMLLAAGEHRVEAGEHLDQVDVNGDDGDEVDDGHQREHVAESLRAGEVEAIKKPKVERNKEAMIKAASTPCRCAPPLRPAAGVSFVSRSAATVFLIGINAPRQGIKKCTFPAEGLDFWVVISEQFRIMFGVPRPLKVGGVCPPTFPGTSEMDLWK